MDRLTTVTDPLGIATVVRYDADGKVTSVTDPMGRITTYQYDALDRQTVGSSTPWATPRPRPTTPMAKSSR